MNSEFELTITVKPRLRKKHLGIRFDMLAFFIILEEFGIKLGDDVSQISKVPFDDMISVAIYAGARSYCVHNKRVVWFDKAKVLYWVDESIIKRGDMKKIGELWMEFMEDFTKNNKVKGDKKKQ